MLKNGVSGSAKDAIYAYWRKLVEGMFIGPPTFLMYLTYDTDILMNIEMYRFKKEALQVQHVKGKKVGVCWNKKVWLEFYLHKYLD